MLMDSIFGSLRERNVMIFLGFFFAGHVWSSEKEFLVGDGEKLKTLNLIKEKRFLMHKRSKNFSSSFPLQNSNRIFLSIYLN
jgi:hypothetical protein